MPKAAAAASSHWKGVSAAAMMCGKRGSMRARIVGVAVAASVTISVLAAGSAAQQPHEHAVSAARLGAVHFDTSCAAAVKQDFDHGVALLHSFWFSAAIQSFNTVVAADPTCAIAQWGIAMSWWGNPFAGFRSPQALKAGLAATDAARASGSGTEREKAYVAAVD